MKFNQRRQFVQVALFSLMALGAGSAFAQTERAAPGLPSPSTPGAPGSIIVSTPELDNRLRASASQLASIKQMTERMAGVKSIGEDFGNELIEPLSKYAKDMSDNFDMAINPALLAAKTQGKQGSTAGVWTFEKRALADEKEFKELDGRVKKIVMQVKEGAIEIDKALLVKATPEERAEFQKNLSPKAGKDLEQKHPDLFRGTGSKSSSVLEPSVSDRVALNWPTLEKISDFLIRPAHAAIALKVYLACKSNSDGTPLTAAQWSNCAAVTQAAITEKNQAWATYQTCAAAAHGGGGGHWKHFHWKATMLTACTTALVIRLA